MSGEARYWFDSWPGIEVETAHPILDRFGTPFGGPEFVIHSRPGPIEAAFDGDASWDAPYTTVSQNRGGPS